MAIYNKNGFIVELEPFEIFVFGSNLKGNHAGGAAAIAKEKFDAVEGIGVGLTGNAYAIPTMGTYEELRLYVEQFLEVAFLLPKFKFLLTKIGTGIAGYSEDTISKLFINAPKNVILPKDWSTK